MPLLTTIRTENTANERPIAKFFKKRCIFLKEKLPYHIYSGVQFFGRQEIKDALSYLRMIAYKDDLSFIRIANVPKRNLGQRRMQFLQQYALPHLFFFLV